MANAKLQFMPVKLKTGYSVTGARLGNNVAWNCVCGYQPPLIVSSQHWPSVICPGCGIRYEMKRLKRGANPTSVEEV